MLSRWLQGLQASFSSTTVSKTGRVGTKQFSSRDYLDQRGKNPFTEPLQQVFPSISLARPAHLLISKPITWHRTAVTNDRSPSPEHLTAGQNQGNGQCVPHPGPPEPLHSRASFLLPSLWLRQIQSLPPGMLLPPAPVHLEGAHSPGLT